MSPELERRLRDAGQALAGPAAGATKRARDVAITPVTSRRKRVRWAATVGGALVALAVGGIALGSLTLAGSVTAGEARGLGFVPAEGWFVRHANTPANVRSPGVTIAANVPLDPGDTVDGFPYSTLQALPSRGIVLVVSFMWLGRATGGTASLPLRLSDAEPYIRWGGQVRPRKPLGQYELQTIVEGHAVDVQAYFGTQRPTPALLAEAQRQLARLVVSPEAVAPVGAPRPPAGADTVTIAFQRYWNPAGNYFTMRFYGSISSGQAGEYVAVLKKECGASYSTAIAGALTQPGGGWEATPSAPPGGGEFRARWKDELSGPVVYRLPLAPWLDKVGSGKFTATVSTYTPPGGKPQSMAGRRIDLQRLSAGQWVRTRSAKLVRKKASSDSFFHTWVATFTVRTKGLRLRAYVPGQSAQPCFSAGASKPRRS